MEMQTPNISGLTILKYGTVFQNNELRMVTKYKNNSRNCSKYEYLSPYQI